MIKNLIKIIANISPSGKTSISTCAVCAAAAAADCVTLCERKQIIWNITKTNGNFKYFNSFLSLHGITDYLFTAKIIYY